MGEAWCGLSATHLSAHGISVTAVDLAGRVTHRFLGPRQEFASIGGEQLGGGVCKFTFTKGAITPRY
jgi:hypothetical protein